MKSKFIALPALLLALLSSSTWAALITVHDGDEFDFLSGDTMFFDAALTVADPMVTFLFRLGSFVTKTGDITC